MTVRRATPADVDALLALWSLARTSHAVTPDSAAATLSVLERSAIFVVDAEGVIDPEGVRSHHASEMPGRSALAGAIVAGWDGWRGNLYRLAVHPSARRSGVASAIVAAAERWLVDQGAGRLSILVAFEDADARRFWESVGFAADADIGRMVRDLDSSS